ncbi:hypothetical protein KI387_005034, partial [Taxus chinensis]
MEAVQNRNRLQKRAPPPLKVSSPPADLFIKRSPIPLLSSLFCPVGEDSDHPQIAVAQENEEVKSGAGTERRACLFVNLGVKGWQHPAVPGLFSEMHTPLFPAKF